MMKIQRRTAHFQWSQKLTLRRQTLLLENLKHFKLFKLKLIFMIGILGEDRRIDESI